MSHENGAEESPHEHIKNRIRQALLLRESHDFISLDNYRQWLDGLILRFNRRSDDALVIERAAEGTADAQRHRLRRTGGQGHTFQHHRCELRALQRTGTTGWRVIAPAHL